MDESWLAAFIAYGVNVTALLALVKFAKRGPSKHQPGGDIRGMDGEARSSNLVETNARCADYRGPHVFVLFRLSHPISKYLAMRGPGTVLTAVAVTVGLFVTVGVILKSMGLGGAVGDPQSTGE